MTILDLWWLCFTATAKAASDRTPNRPEIDERQSGMTADGGGIIQDVIRGPEGLSIERTLSPTLAKSARSRYEDKEKP